VGLRLLVEAQLAFTYQLQLRFDTVGDLYSWDASARAKLEACVTSGRKCPTLVWPGAEGHDSERAQGHHALP